MSKSKYTLREGLAHIKITGEPVYITGFTENQASVIRPVVTRDGVDYRVEQFSAEQLETPLAKIKRELELQEAARDLQEKFQEKRYSLSKEQIKTLQSNNPSHPFNGNGDING